MASHKTFSLPVIPVVQGKKTLYLFSMKAGKLSELFEINRREPDKDKGYQRTLSSSRAAAIASFLDKGNVIAPAIVVSFDKGKARLKKEGNALRVNNDGGIGWVIDGQHRLYGATKAEYDVELPVVAFLDIDEDQQIFQFVKINREAKGVPTSLYYDLLKRMPDKKPAEIAKERAADIAGVLRKNENSPFFDRIVTVTSPGKGQISLTNFVRKVAPLITANNGFFESYTLQEQSQIIENYFLGLRNVFPDEFDVSAPIFFKTVGFGAMLNSLKKVFSITLKKYQTFQAKDVTKTLKLVQSFNFSDWEQLGTGNQAEVQAGRDFMQLLDEADSETGRQGSLKL